MEDARNVVLGIDVSKENLDVNVLKKDVSKSLHKAFKNNAAGITRLLRYASKHKVGLVVMEGTGGLEKRAKRAFTESGYIVKVANPLRVRNFAKGLGILAKTDRLDAYVIACYGQLTPLKNAIAPGKHHTKLAECVRLRNILKAEITAYKNRRRTFDEFLIEEIDYMLKEKEKAVERVEIRMYKILSESEDLRKQCEVISKQKGIGFITAMTLIALLPELGHLDRREIASLAGLAPVARDSGKTKGKRFISGGRFEARKALYMPAWVAVKYEPELKAFYNRLIEKGKKPKVAIVAVMRKLLVRTNAIMRCYLQQDNAPQL